MGNFRSKRTPETYPLFKRPSSYVLNRLPETGQTDRSCFDSHFHVVSFPVRLERLSRFAEVLHRVDVNTLGCRGHIVQGNVVEHALAHGCCFACSTALETDGHCGRLWRVPGSAPPRRQCRRSDPAVFEPCPVSSLTMHAHCDLCAECARVKLQGPSQRPSKKR